ncbi:MAG: insulinase family protein [Bacteroidetes bacterium]|nr:MAG: insulinase family protein [Bacteroidota bacterium]
MQYYFHTLSNGIRLVHKHADSIVAHCGLTINAGSRDELEKEQGLAHFIEHLIFKGTTKRKAYQILSHMENVGGEINAYTGKEDTCVYATFMNNHYARCLDLISDIVFDSVFAEKEILKEKDVVIDEINSYKDNPGEQIFDDFDGVVFKNHSLGANILGTPAHLRKFKREHVFNFLKKNYVTSEMVISSVGNIDFKKLVRLVERYFGHIPEGCRKQPRVHFDDYTPVNEIVKRRNHQVHCIIGNVGYNAIENKKTALVLLNNILGGPGLNSRLNMGIREKYGFCYNIESHYQPYSDTGLFSIYMGTDNDYIDKTIALVLKELTLLREKRLGSLQLKRAKQQLQGQVAISFESNLNEMLSIGKSLLLYDRIDNIIEINEKIQMVTSSELLDVANEVFAPEMLSMLMYRPR